MVTIIKLVIVLVMLTAWVYILKRMWQDYDKKK